MKINFSSSNIELTDAFRGEAQKAINNFSKTVNSGQDQDNGVARVALRRLTHHRSGEVISIDLQIEVPHHQWHSQALASDAYEALHMAVREMERLISEEKDKKISLYKKGARLIKKILRRSRY